MAGEQLVDQGKIIIAYLNASRPAYLQIATSHSIPAVAEVQRLLGQKRIQ